MNHFISRSSWMWALALPVLLSACETSDPGQASLALGATDKAVLLMKVPRGLGYRLQMSNYEPQSHQLQSNSFSGLVPLVVLGNQPYVAEVVAPGSYVFQEFVVQDHWMICFQDNSYSTQVKPGEVLFLGEFDPAPSTKALDEQVVSHGQTVVSGNSFRFYFDNIPPPKLAFTPDREHALAEAQAFVSGKMPKVHGTVRLADYAPAKFGVGTDIYGLQKVCGGYYKGAAK